MRAAGVCRRTLNLSDVCIYMSAQSIQTGVYEYIANSFFVYNSDASLYAQCHNES